MARKAGVRRVVYTSSAAALGVPTHLRGHSSPSERHLWIDERHTWNYRPDFLPFGYAKYLAEREIQRAVALGLDVVIVNPTLIFGRCDIYRGSSSLITLVAERRVGFAPEGGLNCVHIDDVIEGHLAALEVGRTGERYLLGGQNVSYLQLLQTIARVTGAPEPGAVVPSSLLRGLIGPAKLLRPFLRLPVAPDLLRLAGYYFYYNTRKMETGLGIAEHRPISDAIAEAFAWFRGGET
jgi:dihydroflavonol-4-reductase